MEIKLSRAAELITLALKANLVPMVHGSPAIGKSSIVKQIAKKFNLKLIDLRLSQCDPTDLLGFPFIMNERAGYRPMETFPIVGDAIPKGYNGWLLFLDELTSASTAVQAAAYKLILDRMVGLHHLHEKVAIVGAGNLDTDGAIVTPMSTALQSRLVHLQVGYDAREWVNYANEAQYDHRITSYIEFRPDQGYNFSPTHTDKTYASPRTWEFTNRLLKVCDLNRDTLPLFAGTLGEGTARELMGFVSIQDQLPKLGDIIASPKSIVVPNEPSVQFALTGALAANITDTNCEPVMEFVKRMPAEFQVVAVRSMIKRNKAITGAKPVTEWISTASAELF